MRILTMADVDRAVERVCIDLQPYSGPFTFAGIPRGGVPAALAIARHHDEELISSVVSTDDPEFLRIPGDHTVILVDDVAATGATFDRISGADVRVALFAKPGADVQAPFIVGEEVDDWVQFPWEVRDDDGGTPYDAVRRLIEYIGHDLTDPHVQETPRRVLAFLDELRERGRQEFNPTTFETKVGDMVVVRNIPFYSLCAHHMLPFWGEAHVGYIPQGRLIGVSKLARAVAKYASGLTNQEELSHSVAACVAEMTGAGSNADVAVVTEAVHSCMTMRGAKANGAEMVASALLGKFKDSPATRAEFMALVRQGG